MRGSGLAAAQPPGMNFLPADGVPRPRVRLPGLRILRPASGPPQPTSGIFVHKADGEAVSLLN